MKKKLLINLFLCIASIMFSQTNGAIEKWENLQPGSHYDYKAYKNEFKANSNYNRTEFNSFDYSFYQKVEHGDYIYPLYDENMKRVLVTNAETWKGGDVVCVDIYPAEVEENFFKNTEDVIFFGYTPDGKKWLFDNFTSKQYGVYHSALLNIDMPKIKYGLMLEKKDYDSNKLFYFLSHDNGLYSLSLTNYELNKIYQFEEDVEFYSVVYGEAYRGPDGPGYNNNVVMVYKSHFDDFENTFYLPGIYTFPYSYILSNSFIENSDIQNQTWYVLENNQITVKTDIPKYTFNE